MIALALLPIFAGIALRMLAPFVAERCSPRWAATFLVIAAVTVATASGFVLCVVAGFGVVESPRLAHAGRWSATTVSHHFPVPAWIAMCAGTLAALLLAAAAGHVVSVVRSMRVAHRACRKLGGDAYGLIVVDDDQVGAYAVPVRGGRTVVSRRLLAALDGNERRALLAHERAHLAHQHFVYVQLARLAAAANPLLRPVARCVHQVVEAWADDDAATETGDRICVARAMAKASLLKTARPSGPTALAFDGSSDVAFRLRQLLTPSARHTGRYVASLTALTIASLTCALALGTYAHEVFEAAEQVFARAH